MQILLLVGTKRGLFTFRSDAERRVWRSSGPHLTGREVYHALVDPRDYTVWAATDHAVWGPHLHTSSDAGESWQLLETAPHYADGRDVKAIWYIAPGPATSPDTMFAGIEPAGLFVSRDRGAHWRSVESLNEHPTSSTWQPAGGGLALHSIIIDSQDAQRMYCAVSAGGVYRSHDGGVSWAAANRHVRAEFQPQNFPEAGQCVHKLIQHPLMPERLYQQNHCGTYRTDNRGEDWTEITPGLPSDFGYALAVDAHDPATLFVIPEESSHMRATVDGKLRVFRSRDAGASWSSLTNGLPQENAYVSVLREGLCADALEPGGLYFGTSSGHLFASNNGGEDWSMIAGFLPKILSVTVAVL